MDSKSPRFAVLTDTAALVAQEQSVATGIDYQGLLKQACEFRELQELVLSSMPNEEQTVFTRA